CLAAARRRAKLTQIQAAERLGRTQSFVSKIELGLRRVDVLEIILIARGLRANPLKLFAEIARSAGPVIRSAYTGLSMLSRKSLSPRISSSSFTICSTVFLFCLITKHI